jgi:hypothetical protein
MTRNPDQQRTRRITTNPAVILLICPSGEDSFDLLASASVRPPPHFDSAATAPQQPTDSFTLSTFSGMCGTFVGCGSW